MRTMPKIELINHTTGYKWFSFELSQAEVNRRITEISEPYQAGIQCPKPLADGTCGCHVTVKVTE
jgi:hypothetical protein